MASNVKQGPGAKHGADGHGHDDHDDHGGGGHDDHGGGGHCPPPWILTFADMSVLLMSFFVIMLVSSKTDEPKFNAFAAVMRQTFGSVSMENRGGPTIINMQPSPMTGEDNGEEPGEPTSDNPQNGEPSQGAVTTGEGVLDGEGLEARKLADEQLGKTLREALADGEITVRNDSGEVVVELPDGPDAPSADSLAKALAAALAETAESPTEDAAQGVSVAQGPSTEAGGNAPKAGDQAAAGAGTAGEDGTGGVAEGEAGTETSGGQGTGPGAIRAELAQIELGMMLSDALNDGTAKVSREGGKVQVTLGAGGAFASGSADLTAEAAEILSALESVAPRAKRIVVTGHTDNVPVSGGAFEDNWDLAGARARSVVRAIEESGLLPNTELVAVSRGEADPIASNDTPEGREQNRRIEIVIEYEE